MKPLILVKTVVLLSTALMFTAALRAATLGPWPGAAPFMWVTDPFTPVCGTVAVVPPGVLQMSGFTSGSKNGSWLPYNIYDPTYAERVCAAQFLVSPSVPFTNIHVRFYDPGTVGKSGFAVVLKDESGRILDFGARSFFARAQIKQYQFDGTAWTIPSAFAERFRTGNDYYTMEFTNNDDGTISWSMEALQNLTNTVITTGTTTVTYTNIIEVYLNVMTTDASGAANYKWTEFSTEPPVFSPPPLSIAPTFGDYVNVWWPTAWTTNFILEEKADFESNWTPVTAEVFDDGININAILPVGPTGKFFRLQK